MENEKYLLKIGDVAKYNNVSVETLRYYDRISLFTADVVGENGYRYYRPESLLDLDLILWLRMDGMGLDEIRQVMEEKSLERMIGLFQKRAGQLELQIRRLQNQLELCKIYAGHMNLAKEVPENDAYFLSFHKRWFQKLEQPVAAPDKAAYELGLKALLGQYTDPFYYYNSFYGGVFNHTGEGRYDVGLYPAVYNFKNPGNKGVHEMPAGIYAIMMVYGYYDVVYESIPKLLSFIRKNHYYPMGDCHVFKIWQQHETYAPGKEIMEIQIRVEKE